MGDEGALEHVALEADATLQVDAGTGGLGQAVERQRRFVPAAVLPALQIVQDLAAIEHRHRVAEGEGFNPPAFAGRDHLTFQGFAGKFLGVAAAFAHQ